MTPAAAAQSLQKFAFLFDNAVLSSMSRALVRARLAAVTEHMLPKSRTSPVDPVKLTIRSGALAGSVRVERPRVVEQGFVGALIAGGLNIVYAVVHEITGAGRARTTRPFVRPAVEGVVPGFRDDLERSIATARAQAGL